MKPSAKEINQVIGVLKLKSRVSMLGQFSREAPFKILISTVLSARNRDEQTMKSVKLLFAKYKTPYEIASAPLSKLEPLLKYTGFYRTKARRIKVLSQMLIDKYDGGVPDDMEQLISLPGVGRKTAGCVMVYAFNKPAIPVDTHVHRISNRLGWVKTKTPEKTEKALTEIIPKSLWIDVNEVFVIHGQTICFPIIPYCSKCPVERYCKKRNLTKTK